MLIVILTVYFLFIPSFALAWGPITHIYLGTEVFYLGSILPAGIYSLIRRYRGDFLYGNLMADMILAKRYLTGRKNPHSWDTAMSLLESAETEPEKAFSYGYMSHLAADTVAHGSYTYKSRNLRHALLELKADSIIERRYWYEAITIKRKIQRRNDAFLERSLERVIFSFKTNRRLFKGWVVISGLNQERLRSPVILPLRHEITSLHEESLDRIIDVLQNGEHSEVLRKDPIGNIVSRRLSSSIIR